MSVDDADRAASETLTRALHQTSRHGVDLAKGAPLGNPLHDPALVQLARESLSESLGPPRTGSEPFPLTVWRGGAEHTGKTIYILDGQSVPEGTPGAVAKKRVPGGSYTGSIDTFCAILDKRAQVIAPKKTGWVVEPTTNSDGRRTNESTLFMHAVFLDCDDHGSWDTTLAGLAHLGLAHLAYQSSGYTAANPKWRVVLPLAAPFSVQSDGERAAWKKMYHRVRVLVGALGDLREEGFDSRTDAPSIPWFLLEKRSLEDPKREHLFHPGASLDLTALAMSLPVVVEETETKAPRKHVICSDRNPMDDTEIDTIVSALAAVTNAIPRGRRDLYLALPGVLLDRGVTPDDVLTICAEVSLAYPRRHADKHKDNVHNARTTVAKWVAGDPTYTRIGTLQGTFPDVAAVVDEVVPDLVKQSIAASMEDGAAIHEDAAVDVNAPRSPEDVPIPIPPPMISKGASVRRKDNLRKKLERLAEEKAELADKKKSEQGKYLVHVLRGGFASFLDVRAREEVVKSIFNLVGWEMGTGDKAIKFDEIVEIVEMIGAVSAETYKLGAAEFAAAVEKRIKWDNDAPKRQVEANARESEQFVATQAKMEARRRAQIERRAVAGQK